MRTHASQYRTSAVACILILAFALRVVAAQGDVELDEVFSLDVASLGWSSMIHQALLDYSHPPAHIFALHLWTELTSATPLAARALSVVFSMLSLYLAYEIARKVLSDMSALIVLLFLAVSPFFVFYGQQARPYSLVMLATTLNVVTFLRFIEKRDSPAAWTHWTASCWLLVWSHYMGAALLLPQFFAFLKRHWQIPELARLLPAALAIIAAAGWLWAGMHTRVLENIALDATNWMSRPSVRDLVALPNVVIGVPFVTALAAAIIWFVPFASTKRLLQPIPVRVVVLLAGAGTMTALLFIFSFVLPFSVWAERQLIGAAALTVIVWAWMLEAAPRVLRAAVATYALVASLVGLYDVLPGKQRPPWSEIVTYLEDREAQQCIAVEEWWTYKQLTYVTRGRDSQVVDASLQSFALDCRPTSFVCRAGFCATSMSLLGSQAPFDTATFTWAPTLGIDQRAIIVFIVTDAKSPNGVDRDSPAMK